MARHWTPEMAREQAKRLLGDLVEGAVPAAKKKAGRKAKRVAELCDLVAELCDLVAELCDLYEPTPGWEGYRLAEKWRRRRARWPTIGAESPGVVIGIPKRA